MHPGEWCWPPSTSMTAATARLLLRERHDSSTGSLSSAVDRVLSLSSAQHYHSRLYQLELVGTQLRLAPRHSPPPRRPATAPPSPPTRAASVQTSSPAAADEGFESDIDSLSIVSSDAESLTVPLPEDGTTSPGTNLSARDADSANGSAASDSDESTCSTDTKKTSSTLVSTAATVVVDGHSSTASSTSSAHAESHSLVNTLCYTDMRCVELLICVLQGELLVFRFESAAQLNTFYSNFTSLKAVTNQRTYHPTSSTSEQPASASTSSKRFNLLHRTDFNGVTHIEISTNPAVRQQQDTILSANDTLTSAASSKIISIEAPLVVANKQTAHFLCATINRHSSKLRSSRSTENLLLDTLDDGQVDDFAKSKQYHSLSYEDLLDDDKCLRKVWSSVENAAATLRPQERVKRKPKSRAPPPPLSAVTAPPALSNQSSSSSSSTSSFNEPPRVQHQQYSMSLSRSNQFKAHFQQFFSLNSNKVKYKGGTTCQPFKYSEPKVIATESQKTKTIRYLNPWSSAQSQAPAQLLMHPQAFYPPPPATNPNPTVPPCKSMPQFKRLFKFNQAPLPPTNSSLFTKSKSSFATANVSNRLFGMSAKLRDFSPKLPSETTADVNPNRWASMSDLGHVTSCVVGYHAEGAARRNSGGDNSFLKSVIKKEDAKRKNEKKVTFSAFTTVKVL